MKRDKFRIIKKEKYEGFGRELNSEIGEKEDKWIILMPQTLLTGWLTIHSFKRLFGMRGDRNKQTGIWGEPSILEHVELRMPAAIQVERTHKLLKMWFWVQK